MVITSKKKVLLISGVLLTLIIIFSTIFIVNKNSVNNKIVMQDNNKPINNSFLTLMLEQEDGTYQESTSNTWPGEGYIFNENLSGCENGGELSWNDETKAVTLHSNKSDGCYVYFDIYNKPTINSINLGEVTNNSITITVSATNGTNEISNYYYVINDGTPVSSTSNTYTFNGLNAGQTYTIKVYVVDSEGYSSDTSSLNVETENPILLADWVVSQYNGVQGNNGIYYHTSSLANSAGDNSYRYAGANPNNYVCFGSDTSPCPSDNLYRIIGVFANQVKLIKASNLGSYVWNSNGTNTWTNSSLNTSILNGTYLNGLESKWSNLISFYNWKINGMSSENGLSTPKTVYNYEVGSNSSSTTYSAKMGLIYVSDYAFAASQNYWTTNLSSYNNVVDNNWVSIGVSEWTISRNTNSTSNSSVFNIGNTGRIYSSDVLINPSKVIRPVFYLNSNVTYISGSGTSTDPIRLGD